jgi:hypothetical protein
LEWFALLLLSCLAALFTVVSGDCWDNIKHFYMFNLLLDACLIALAAQLTAGAAGQTEIGAEKI